MQIVFTNVITGDTAFLEHSYTDAEFKECSVYDILADIDRFEDDASYKFFLNDEPVSGEDLHVYVEDDDLLLIVETPAGAALGLVGIWKAIADIALSMILSWAANKLFGADEPKDQDLSQSSTYSLNNQNNATAIGQYAQVNYGTVRLYPRIVNQPLVFFRGAEMYLSRIFALGQGSHDIKKVLIGSQDVTDDKDITVQKFKTNKRKWDAINSNHNTKPEWSTEVINRLDTVSNDKINFKSATFEPTVHSINSDLVKLHVNIEYHGGLWDITRSGNKLNYAETLIVDILDDKDVVVFTKEFKNETPSKTNPKRQKQDAARYTYIIDKPANATNWAKVLVRKKKADSTDPLVKQDCVISGIYEMYKSEVMDYGDLECVAVTMKASGTTTGDGKFNLFIERTDVGNSLKEVVTDIYTNSLYGAALEGKDLQFDSIASHTLIDCSYEENVTVLDAMDQVTKPQMFHIIPHNAKIKLKKDKAQTLPVQRYDASRMYNVETSYLFDEYREVNDGIEVEYRDSDWKPVTTKYPPTCIMPQVVTTFGLESKSSAEAYCKYLYKQQKARRQMVTFSTDIQARPLELLDLIELKHDTISSDGKAKLFQVMKVASNEQESKIECIKYDSSIFN